MLRNGYAIRENPREVRNYFQVLDESVPQADLGVISEEHYAALMQDPVYAVMRTFLDETKDELRGTIKNFREKALDIMRKIRRRQLDERTYAALYNKIVNKEPIFQTEPIRISFGDGLELRFGGTTQVYLATEIPEQRE